MTGDLLIDSLISIGAIALMVLAARFAFPASGARVTREMAEARLSLDEPDFKPQDWLEDDDGRVVLAAGGDEFVLVARLGLDPVVRRFHGDAVKADATDGALTLRLADPTLPKVVIANADAASWARKFAPSGGIPTP